MSKTLQFARPSNRIRRLIGGTVATFAAFAAIPLGTAEVAHAAGNTTYYVSPSGSDSASGTDPSRAFKTIGRVSNMVLQPGDQILFERGGSWVGKMEMWRSGAPGSHITIGAYGPKTAPKPRLTNHLDDMCMMVGGSYITVSDLYVSGCRIGIWTRGTGNLITRVEATDNMHGIEVDPGSDGIKVLRNYLHDNDHMSPNTPGGFDDYGAVGVVVAGDRTEVAYNRIDGNYAPSADFVRDGSAVEIYGGIGTFVHHNNTNNNNTFTELGNSRSADTVFAYNRVRSNLKDSYFLVTRGADDYFGPVANTLAVNNSVKLTGPDSVGFACYAGCSKSLFASYNNILDVNGRVGYLVGSMAGGNNIYWNGNVDFPTLPGDKVTDPKFKNDRLVLSTSSPAVDQVATARMDLDMRGRKVGVDGDGDGRAAADIGAFEVAPPSADEQGGQDGGESGGKGGKGKGGKGKGGKGKGGKSDSKNGGEFRAESVAGTAHREAAGRNRT